MGIVGCGSVTQLFHLPNLCDIDGVRVAAICDTAAPRLELARQRLPQVPLHTDDWRRLLSAGLDGVVIATEDMSHERLARAFLDAGVHVFVEKPLALTARGASVLADQAASADLVLFTGYQRRFDEAVAYVRDRLAALGSGAIRSVSVRDFSHDNDLVIADIAPRAMLSEAFLAGRSDYGLDAEWEALLGSEFPTAAADKSATYRLFFNLACHDMSVLIDLFGPPRSVAHTDFSPELVGLAAYRFDHFSCVLQFGQTRQKRFDQQLTIVCVDTTVDVVWPSPFLEHAATTVTVHQTAADSVETSVVEVSFASRFRAELVGFVDAVRAGHDGTDAARHSALVTHWLAETVARDCVRS